MGVVTVNVVGVPEHMGVGLNVNKGVTMAGKTCTVTGARWETHGPCTHSAKNVVVAPTVGV